MRYTVKDFEQEEFRETVKEADLILAVDRFDPDREAIVYGLDSLLEIQETGRARYLKQIKIHISFSEKTTELEYVIAAMQVLKGKDDYRRARQMAKAKGLKQADTAELVKILMSFAKKDSSGNAGKWGFGKSSEK